MLFTAQAEVLLCICLSHCHACFCSVLHLLIALSCICFASYHSHDTLSSRNTLGPKCKDVAGLSELKLAGSSTDLQHNGLGHIFDPHVRLRLLAAGVLVVLGFLSIWHKVRVQLLTHCLQLSICHAIAHSAIHNAVQGNQGAWGGG